MSDTTDTMPDVIWVEKYRRVMRETPPPMYLSEYEEYVKRSLMDDLQAQLKRRCACEFVDGKCVEPCKYHSELQKRLDEKDERIATLEAERSHPAHVLVQALLDGKKVEGKFDKSSSVGSYTFGYILRHADRFVIIEQAAKAITQEGV